MRRGRGGGGDRGRGLSVCVLFLDHHWYFLSRWSNWTCSGGCGNNVTCQSCDLYNTFVQFRGQAVAWGWLRYSDVLPKLTEGETRFDIVLRNLSLSLSLSLLQSLHCLLLCLSPYLL